MSLGKFAAAAVIFTGKVAYKGALRVGNSLSTASDDFSERWDSPVNGFDATIEKVRVDEDNRVKVLEAKRALRKHQALEAAAKAVAPREPVAPMKVEPAAA